MTSRDDRKSLREEIENGGWDALDFSKLQELAARERALARMESVKQAAIVKAMAATPEGRRFLQEFLRPRTIEARVTAAEAAPTSADLYALAAARRDGRNSIWWAIQAALTESGDGAASGSKEVV